MAKHKKRGKFRSKSEEIVYNYLTDLAIKVRYEEDKINYTWLEYKTYIPDFILPNGIILEVKGRFVLEDRKKHLFIQEQKPDLGSLRNPKPNLNLLNKKSVFIYKKRFL